MKDYLLAITKIVDYCFNMYPNERLLDTWNIKSYQHFFESKADLILETIIEQKIPVKYFSQANKRIFDNYSKFPPNLIELIKSLKPELNYESLFSSIQRDCKRIKDYLDGYHIQRSSLSKFSNTVAHLLKELKGIDILAQKEYWINGVCQNDDLHFSDCKDDFIEIFTNVDFMKESDYIEINNPIPKLELARQIKADTKVVNENLARIRAIMSDLPMARQSTILKG